LKLIKTTAIGIKANINQQTSSRLSEFAMQMFTGAFP